MRYRKLRITWTVFCGIACVLLLALWARSYWWMDNFGGHVLTYSFGCVCWPNVWPYWVVLYGIPPRMLASVVRMEGSSSMMRILLIGAEARRRGGA